MKPVKELKQILKPWPKNIHKHDRGHVLVIAGSYKMSGAALLTAQAAFRTGAGLVTLAYPESLARIFRLQSLESLHLPLRETTQGSISGSNYSVLHKAAQKVDAVAIGPGLTRVKQTEQLVVKLLDSIDKPAVCDADALNALADLDCVGRVLSERKAVTIITPHAGEMARLAGISARKIETSRKQTAIKFAKLWQVVLVLKGNRSIVVSATGRAYVNRTGGPALATAGSGDVLTGMLAALIAQHKDKPFAVAQSAVYIHGQIGDLCKKIVGERSVVASDILKRLPACLARHPSASLAGLDSNLKIS